MKKVADYIKKIIKTPAPKISLDLHKTLEISHLSKTKRVKKPWGFELWLSDASDTPYALKVIYLKKGTKTSLQVHKEKSEHNFILSGEINLYYQDSKDNKIKSVRLEAGHVIKTLPTAIHRIEALGDVLLVEASSHQLDDVTRLEDDYLRGHGKIESEHK